MSNDSIVLLKTKVLISRGTVDLNFVLDVFGDQPRVVVIQLQTVETQMLQLQLELFAGCFLLAPV